MDWSYDAEQGVYLAGDGPAVLSVQCMHMQSHLTWTAIATWNGSTVKQGGITSLEDAQTWAETTLARIQADDLHDAHHDLHLLSASTPGDAAMPQLLHQLDEVIERIQTIMLEVLDVVLLSYPDPVQLADYYHRLGDLREELHRLDVRVLVQHTPAEDDDAATRHGQGEIA